MRRHDYSNCMISKALSITLLLCAVAASCASNPTRPSPVVLDSNPTSPSPVVVASIPTRPSAVVLGQPFELRPGNSARLADGLEIRFDGVRSDSRCPADVQCVWAGDATIAISAAPPAAAPVERELHTQPGGGETVVNDYTIKLIALMLSPRSDRPVRPDDYVATLTVSRR